MAKAQTATDDRRQSLSLHDHMPARHATGTGPGEGSSISSSGSCRVPGWWDASPKAGDRATRGRLRLSVMAPRAAIHACVCRINTARRGWRACARHDGRATTAANLTLMAMLRPTTPEPDKSLILFRTLGPKHATNARSDANSERPNRTSPIGQGQQRERRGGRPCKQGKPEHALQHARMDRTDGRRRRARDPGRT